MGTPPAAAETIRDLCRTAWPLQYDFISKLMEVMRNARGGETQHVLELIANAGIDGSSDNLNSVSQHEGHRAALRSDSNTMHVAQWLLQSGARHGVIFFFTERALLKTLHVMTPTGGHENGNTPSAVQVLVSEMFSFLAINLFGRCGAALLARVSMHTPVHASYTPVVFRERYA